jgi:hypothetical protein
MLKNLTKEELFFCESFYNVRRLVECTFSKGTPRNWNDGKPCISLRTYQRPFLGFDSSIEDDDKLSELQNFRRRIEVGSHIIVSARKIGKTFIALIANILSKLIYYNDLEMALASYDEKHVNKIHDIIKEFMSYHNFYKSYKQTIRGSPESLIETKTGNKLIGINETVKGKSPGENWWGHHFFIIFQDEIQAETEVAYSHKVDAVSDFGAMEILCGIPLITKTSPLGRTIRDEEMKKKVIRLPQYISYWWDEKTKQKRIRAYGGQESSGYRINVAADLIEGAQGVFDLESLKGNLNKKRVTKHFEITKKNFSNYKNLLVLEPIFNSSKTFVVSDVGDAAATEINVYGKVNNKYQLVYNITTYRLSLTKELPELIEYIFRKVGGTYCSVDCTIMGKPVFEILSERLNEKVLDEKGNLKKFIKRVYWCAFNEDIVTGFLKDDEGHLVRDGKGQYIEKHEPTLHFAVTRLKEMFYDKQFDIPEDDYKFDLQFSTYISIISGNRVVYDTTSEDHYVQSFEVFAILEWNTEQLPHINPIEENITPGYGVY